MRKSQENEEAPDERSRLLRELDALKMQKLEHEQALLRRKREEEELTTASVQEEMDKVRAEVGKEVDAKRRHEELDRLRQESDAFKGRPQDETELLRKLGWLPAAGQDAGSNAAPAKDQKPEAPKQKGTRLQGDSAAEPTEAKKQNEEPLAPTSKKQDEADEQEEDETQKTGQPGNRRQAAMALNRLRKNASRMAQMPGKLRDLLAQDDEWTKSKLIGMLADHGGNLAALKTFFEQKVEKTDYTETLTNLAPFTETELIAQKLEEGMWAQDPNLKDGRIYYLAKKEKPLA